MKSKIQIDVDHDNQPIIKIEYIQSEDVRDKLVKKFLETFGGDSCWAKFNFEPEYTRQDSFSSALVGTEVKITPAILRPICKFDLPEESEIMKKEGDAQKQMRKNLKLKE